MHLCRLELEGFKSFARREVFDFERGITGVVGPNGCGKSNIIDAIRWVLGEQSRKDLRMQASSDVIFGGTTQRKAAKEASIAITFDNAEGFIAGAGKRFTVKRTLSKTNGSSYFLNNEEIKLRDLKALFAGTGIGPDGYTIMGQGKIDALLQNNPLERRVVFEEAAGIWSFRQQRASTQRKLEVVDKNVGILNERMKEASSRLRSMKGQATRALKYQEYQDRLRSLRLQLALNQFHGFTSQREELLLKINEEGRKEGKVQKELALVLLELESFSEQQRKAQEQLEEHQQRVSQAERALQEHQTQQARFSSRKEALERSIERLKEDREHSQEQNRVLNQRVEELESSLEKTRVSVAQAEAESLKLEEELKELKHTGAQLQKTIDGERASYIDALHEKNTFLNEKLQIEAEINNGAKRRLKLDRSLEERKEESLQLQTQMKRLAELYQHRSAQEQAFQKELEEQKGRRGDFNIALAGLRKQQHELGLELSRLHSRIEQFEENERTLENFDAGVRKLLEDQAVKERFGVLGLLAQGVARTSPHTTALEAVLGSLGEALVLETQEQAQAAFHFLAEEKNQPGTLIALDSFQAQKDETTLKPDLQHVMKEDGVSGLLWMELQLESTFEPIFKSLLTDWLLVESLEVGLELQTRYPEKQLKLVTTRGQVLRPEFLRLLGNNKKGLISQRSELERLQREQRALLKREAALSTKISKNVEKVQKTEDRIEELRKELYHSNSLSLETKTELEYFQKRFESLAEEKSVLSSELEEQKQEGEEHQQRLEYLKNQLEEKSAKLKALDKSLQELQNSYQNHEKKISKAQDLSLSQQVGLAQERSRLNAFEQSLGELRHTMSDFSKRMLENSKRLENEEQELVQLEVEKQSSQSKLEELQHKHQVVFAEREKYEGKLLQLQESAQDFRQRERRYNQELLALKEKIAEIKLNEEKAFLAADNLRERVMEDYELDIDLAYRDYKPEQAQLDEAAERAAQSEIESLKRSIRSLGNVNMEAVDELEEVESRFKKLSVQEKDLLRAKQALEKAIERLENEARKRFMATFEQTRQHFQQLFRKMFGGGSADILLLNPEDVLESGIEIIAKPPGMEPKTLSLLSGGQRTMIAVALMFSLFETNNVPFALLDEVDAALDDSNVERFCMLLEEFSQKAQFIVITHHKRTMSHAHQLYGVTMQERGISKKVFVDLRNYDDQNSESLDQDKKDASLSLLAS